MQNAYNKKCCCFCPPEQHVYIPKIKEVMHTTIKYTVPGQKRKELVKSLAA